MNELESTPALSLVCLCSRELLAQKQCPVLRRQQALGCPPLSLPAGATCVQMSVPRGERP